MLLKSQSWGKVLNSQTTNQAFDHFHNIIQKLLNSACPYSVSKVKYKTRLWDEESEFLKRTYLEALNKEICTGKDEDKRQTAQKKKEYDLKLKTLKRQQTTAYIEQSENKSKAIWKIINQERAVKTSQNKQLSLNIDGNIMEEPQEIANCFNKYFSEIAEKTLKTVERDGKARRQLAESEVNTNMILTATDYAEVCKAIEDMKPKTSYGIDDVSAKLAKNCKEEIATPLVHIINSSFQQGAFPTELKTSKIYPKYKNGSQTDLKSYRPISLVSTFSKIIEKIALKRLLDHLQTNNLLTNHQHGFLKGRSTKTAITELVEYVIDQIEDGNFVNSLFLDFSKAFDCLDCDLLLEKLNNLGIKGTTACWFRSYISGRQQVVEIKYNQKGTSLTARSSKLPVKRGVPQGSVLGPILFLLLTNDLPRTLENFCQTVMYADDTVLTLASKCTEDLEINSYIAFNMAKQYCDSSDLVLNETKTTQVIYSSRRDKPAGLPSLRTEESTKYLGITLDKNLDWKPHINQLCKKLTSGVYVIRRIKEICGQAVAKTAYFALFESHLQYGIAAWGGTANCYFERVLVHQKKAVRCLANLGLRDSCRDAFCQLKILTVTSLYIREVILHAVNTKKPRLGDGHEHNTRYASNFVLPSHHLTLYSKKPSYKGALYFNVLPDFLKNEPERRFKRKLTLWLEDNPFYSEKEFLHERMSSAH